MDDFLFAKDSQGSSYRLNACPLVYGPVESRRHGRSLGVNLGNPERKICTWACVYCQCGNGLLRAPKVEEAAKSDELIQKLSQALSKNSEVDCVTFAGNTEPTAHLLFPQIIERVLELRRLIGGKWQIQCLTNGTEVHREEIRTALKQMDTFWIKLDCGVERMFQRFNRPVKGVTFQSHLKNLKSLEAPRIQTLLWDSQDRGRTNFTEDNQAALLSCYQEIGASEVHLVTLARTPAAPDLRPVPEEGMLSFLKRCLDAGIETRYFQ